MASGAGTSEEAVTVRRLWSATLPELPASVAVPRYDRSAVRAGIVHLGVGGFHRAHQAAYVDELLAAGGADDWGICGVGVLPRDRRMREVLQSQDLLYSVAIRHRDGRLEPRVVGSIVEYHLGADGPDVVVERLADERTRIVSLTITEGGYRLHPVTGEFDADDPAIQADLAPDGTPCTVFGLVAEALVRRRHRGIAPFTVVSCDNVEGNGEVARRMFAAFARLRDEELGDWVEREVAFPSSMVDRITPATTDADRDAVSAVLGVRDEWPVVCEPFRQWVLEDDFPAGRPPLEEVGVQMVADVRPYEAMKVRLLNAGHQVLCYLGYLAGHRHVHEVAQDPPFAALLQRYLVHEAIPTLQPVPGIDVAAYAASVLDRFADPGIRDGLDRICADSSDRVPKFVLPVVRQQLTDGGSLDVAALAVAAWARYAEGVDEQGVDIPVVDPLRHLLMPAAARQRTDPMAFLQVREVFGDLAGHDRFAASYRASLASLHRRGARATVEEVVQAVAG